MATPVFDGATEQDVHDYVTAANEKVNGFQREIDENKSPPDPKQMYSVMPYGGKTTLFDGRTGELAYAESITVDH